MTHPSHQTNGASLEDCHTNFFALVSDRPRTRARARDSGSDPYPRPDDTISDSTPNFRAIRFGEREAIAGERGRGPPKVAAAAAGAAVAAAAGIPRPRTSHVATTRVRASEQTDERTSERMREKERERERERERGRASERASVRRRRPPSRPER